MEATAAESEKPDHVFLENDSQKYRKTADKLPTAMWLIACVGACERFAYYGYIIVLQNFIQYSRNDPLHPGALGLGESLAALMINAFQMVSYATPLAAAVVADRYLGRMKTITYSLLIYAVGLLVLTMTSIPMLLDRDAGLPGVIISMVIISFALGGVKASIAPLLAEQIPPFEPYVRVLKSGVKTLVTHEETLEYAFNAYYWAVNIGGQSMAISPLMEKYVGYWSTFTFSLGAICLGLILLLLGRTRCVDTQPIDMIARACRICYIAIRNGFSLDAARPESLAEAKRKPATWDNDFIDEMKLAMAACGLCAPLVIYWLCQNQLTSNTIAQAGMMDTHGVPNDLIPDANAIAVILLLPLVTHGLNPLLRHYRIEFGPISRISLGFMIEALAMGYAAIVQALIYAAPPCYSRPLVCAASNGGKIPNNVNIAVQLPVYVLEGLSEIFSTPAFYEYAYTKAPRSMKSLLQAIFSATTVAGPALAIALAPMYYNPALLYMYVSLGSAMGLCAIGSYFLLHR